MLDRFVGRVARAVARRAGIRVSRVVLRSATDGPPAEPRQEVRCVLMKKRELLPWCDDPGLELTRQHVNSAFERGDLCLGAYDAERLVGYQWIGFGATPHVAGLWVRFKPTDFYIYKKFVRPDYRGMRIAGALNAAANAVAARLNCDRVICLIDLHNLASWRAAKRSRSRAVGYVGYLAWFGLSIPFRSAGAAEEGFMLCNPSLREGQAVARAA